MKRNEEKYDENLQSEKALLSSLIFEPDACLEIEDLKIDANDFSDVRYQVIFQHIEKLKNAGGEIDLVTLFDSLQKSNDIERIGGTNFLMNLNSDFITSANVRHYAHSVKERSVAMGVYKKAKRLEEFAQDLSLSKDELIEKVNQTLIEINDSTDSGSSLDVRESILEVIKSIRDKDSVYQNLTKTGFVSLDDKVVGLSPGQLIILAARPSMGKTSLALNIAHKVADRYNERVVVFSLEMIHKELSERLISMESCVNSRKFKTKDFNSEELKKVGIAAEKCSRLPITIDDSSSISLYRIRNQCLRHKAKYKKLRLVLIDYLQLIPCDERKNGNKADEIGKITRGLKLLSKEIACPIILLSQLNRNVEGRDNKRPFLADLRDSGAIEQDADMVWFIYRDDVYNSESKTPAEAEVIIAKNRGGEIGTAKLAWKGEFTKFTEIV